jgi:uncharacterized protein YggU (UPF0235/DUF167 family)
VGERENPRDGTTGQHGGAPDDVRGAIGLLGRSSRGPAADVTGFARGTAMRVEVRVKPRSSRRRVGGRYGSALVVAVREPAVDGRATAACLEAVADAFDVRPGEVSLITGASSRTKVVEVIGAPERVLTARLERLLDDSGRDGA